MYFDLPKALIFNTRKQTNKQTEIPEPYFF